MESSDGALATARDFEDEARALSAFIEILESEQTALAENRIDEVNGLAGAKARHLAVLTRHSEKRAARLEAAGISPDAEGARAWLAGLPENSGASAAWERVTELARRARDLNQANGWVVSLQMQRIRRQLAFLAKASSNHPVYSADGVARLAMRSRSLGEA